MECYQFCYVDEDGLVRGTSVPFQFCPDPDEDIIVVINMEKVEEMELLSEELYQENQELKTMVSHAVCFTIAELLFQVCFIFVRRWGWNLGPQACWGQVRVQIYHMQGRSLGERV